MHRVIIICQVAALACLASIAIAAASAHAGVLTCPPGSVRVERAYCAERAALRYAFVFWRPIRWTLTTEDMPEWTSK